MKNLLILLLTTLCFSASAQNVVSSKGDVTDFGWLIPGDGTATADNNSTAAMVIKRYTAADNISVPLGTPGSNSVIDTQFDPAIWEAFISGVQTSTSGGTTSTPVYAPFSTPSSTSNTAVSFYRLLIGSLGGVNRWVVSGDLAHLNEQAIIDVLFIKKSICKADAPQPNPF